MAKLDTGEETDTVYTYKSKDKNILRSFSHFSKIATSNNLAFLKKKKFNTMFGMSYSAFSFTEFCSYNLKWGFRSSWESKIYPLRYMLINVPLMEKKYRM